MIASLAGLLVPALLGASLGSFQSAEILAKDRNLIGLAGQVVAQEGDRTSFSFPVPEAWYRLGLGFGDFGVKLTRRELRGSLKLPLPVGVEPFKLAIEPALGVGESISSNTNTFTQSLEVSLPATYIDITIAPRGALTLSIVDPSGSSPNSRSRDWMAGSTFTRRVKGEKVDWWGEMGVYWGRASTSRAGSSGSTSYLLFAPGIGASIEF